MKAMVLSSPGAPLSLEEVPTPTAADDEVVVRVRACGICRTDLHVVDGELDEPSLPLIPGHQIVGEVVERGAAARRFRVGDRVGVPWLGGACGHCEFCARHAENLCDAPVFTGYQRDGGFAEYASAREDFCFPIPHGYSDVDAAPLLCAGLIGFRAYRMIGEHVSAIGLYGFGSAAHILIQIARHDGKRVHALTRPGDGAAQDFARALGATSAGDSDQPPPEVLDAAIIFAPVGALVPEALRRVRKGGVVVAAGIHMSDIPSFPYRDLWGERVIRSVANLTRDDGEAFFALAPRVPVRTETTVYSLDAANEALRDLRDGRLTGSGVIVP